MTENTNNLEVVEETNIGVYVWQMPDGTWVGDDDGHYMMIASRKGDRKRIAQLAEAAKYYGVSEGRPLFRAGRRPVDDEEYGRQLTRQKLGLIPDDEGDFGALRDALEGAKKNG